MSASHLRFVPDLPAPDPVLGFEDYADALADAIANTEPAQLTVGIYGPWGSGKSSLLKAIGARLRSRRGRDIIDVEFDAWRYQRNQELIVPLLHAVLKRVEAEEDAKLVASVKRLVKAVGLSLSFRLPVVGRDVSIEEIRRTWSDTDSDEIERTLDAAFALPFESLRKVGEGLGDRRIVILVDDLDRCSGDTVVAMLESINVITDVAGFVFVLALDYDVIVEAVTSRYPHVDGHRFVEKIIQVPFRIPGLDAAEDALLSTLVPALDLGGGLTTDDATLASIVDLAFGANPRSTKRFINALSLILTIFDHRGADVDARIVAALLAGEMRWPDELSDLRTAVRAGDPDPVRPIVETADQGLRAFAAAHLATDVGASTLAAILRLTGTVTRADPEAPDDDSFRALTERNRTELEAQIAARGFVLAAQSKALWYPPDRRDLRIRFARQVVRVEQPSTSYPGEWELDRSFSMGREMEGFLAHVDERLARPEISPAGP